MPTATITGIIKKIGTAQQVTEKFKKREIWLDCPDGKYEQKINLDFNQNNCDRLDDFKVGDEVIIKLNIKGREYEKDGTTKRFSSLEGFNINPVPVANMDKAMTQEKIHASNENYFTKPAEQGGDDLPF